MNQVLFIGATIDFANVTVNIGEDDTGPFSLCIVLTDDEDGLQRPVEFTVALDSGNSLSLSLSQLHLLLHCYGHRCHFKTHSISL